MDLITADRQRCKSSYRCVRVCPVKAVRIRDGKAEIVAERCVACGLCVNACSQKALRARSDVASVRRLLARERTVAILAPEYVAAFHPIRPQQVEAALELVGFYSIETTILGEELVATEYERLLEHRNGQLYVRSTCPAVVARLQLYHPQLATNLAPLISPMVAQGRLIKAIYNEPVRTVYIGPCLARKGEAADPQVSDAIDVVLTFDEAKLLLEEHGVDPIGLSVPDGDENRPTLFKEASLIDGFPRDILARSNILDTDIRVMHGSRSLSDLIEAVERREMRPKVVDVLQCDGCVAGPGMATLLSATERKRIISEYYRSSRDGSSTEIRFADLRLSLPSIATARGFTPQPIREEMPSPAALSAVLAQADRHVPEKRLDCGACGYDTCHDQALAVSQGLAEWRMCHPFQQEVLSGLIDRLRELSVTDGLTGLVNHRTFNERLQEEIQRANRYGGVVSVLMIDVDLFKSINDSLGHVIGDNVLRAITSVLSECVRTSDIVGRWGGDEFSVILPEIDKTQAFAVAEKLRTRVQSTPIKVTDDGNQKTLKMTISVGVAASSGVRSADDLVTEADRALYRAKANGRNRTEIGSRVIDGAPHTPEGDLRAPEGDLRAPEGDLREPEGD